MVELKSLLDAHIAETKLIKIVFICVGLEQGTQLEFKMADDSNSKIEKLNGSNYKTWKFNCKLVLMNKDLWGIVVGTDKAPVADEDGNVDAKLKREFESRSNQAYSIIALSIQKEIQTYIVSTSNPKEAWDTLENQFSFVSITQLVRVYRKFYASSMNEGGNVMEHITKMTQLAQDLKEMGKDIESKEFAVVVLGSLPSSYEMFVTSLNARGADTLDWNNIKGALIEEYTKITEKSTSRSSVDDAFFSHGGEVQRNQQRDQHRPPPRPNQSNNNANRGGGNFRNNDGNFRHNDNNFRNNDGQRNQQGNRSNNSNRGNQNNQNSRTCFSCGGRGHLSRDCANNNRNNRNNEHGRFVELTNTSLDDLSIHDDLALATSERIQDSHNQDISVEYTDEIALAASGTLTQDNEWFIDSAASKHMTWNKDSMSNYSSFNEDDVHNVALGDDYTIQAEGKGTVELLVRSEDKVIKITLHDVLCS